MSGEPPGEGCEMPNTNSSRPKAVKEDLTCILCGSKMLYQKNLMTHVCMNKEHGVLAYYDVDNCYFTSREDIGARFLKEGRKFHFIQPEVLQMIGVEP